MPVATPRIPDPHAQLREVLTKVDKVSGHLCDMENDLAHMRGFAQLVAHLAGSPSTIEPDVLLVVADGMTTVQRRLQAAWEQANSLAFELRRT
ncbi:hypothetical protein [Methylobacterium isbiliense]|jgi:hypothetical protein|uniref:Uncharacterized protein n=1 Tax=Methylobacterium isbiliense TaxID=315478 RepID=A0ABQ4SQS0_9HYPH|nr:hypothetical protein [Methylobacterium isbiliense]MDN3627234.1 hypothetical protein [Methylobacterium isbiliense]GJE04026.1 hypothetical protein GMJLKIPL_5986 [Methylobacterium isbiliense]